MNNRYVDQKVSARAKEIETMLTGDFSQGVPCSERGFWDNAKKLDATTLIADAEKLIGEPFPVMTEEIYFTKGGSITSDSDQICFKSMRILEKLVLAECVENKGRFVDYISSAIETILDRKSWVRSGHDSAFSYSDYKGVHGQIDLYSSSVGWRFATFDKCLGEKLSPDLRARMKAKVREKIIDVFFKRLDEVPEEIMINGIVPIYWLDSYDNWLAVCLGGVLGAVLYFGEEEEKAIMIALYEKQIQKYLNSLPGGYCVEGLSYWGYGFGKFIAAADLIFRATGGKIDLYAQPEFKAAAEFGFKISVCKDVYPSAADSCFGATPIPFMMKYCALREGIDYDYEYEALGNDIYIVMMMLNFDKRLVKTLESELIEPIRSYFEKQGILLSRTADNSMGVYIQSGTNHEPHNHNDIGNFIIAAEGETFVADPGYSRYGGITFSPERYKLEVLSSLGHSVPKVAGELQGPAVFGSVNTNFNADRNDSQYEEIKYFGKVIGTEFTDSKDVIAIDMTNAYESDNLKSLIRKMTFDRIEKTVTVSDEFEFTKEDEIETAFITFYEVELDGNNAHILGEKNTMNVAFDGNGTMIVRTIKDAVIGNHDIPVYPLRVAKKIRAKQGVLTVKFSLSGRR